MKIIAQKYRDGSLTLLDVPVPATKAGGVLVRSSYSVISAGTELMKVAESKLSLLGKAKARPDQVRKVLQTLSQQGPLATYQKIANRLDSYTPLGYSLAGVIEDVGADVDGFRAGQRVACGGNQFALHAEFNWVPVNLCVAVPDNVSDEQAAFATVGAVAMQGFRQAEISLGETAVVIGLGLLGQILVRILRAAGIHAFGIDIDAERCRLAMEGGAAACATRGGAEFEGFVEELRRATSGAGADCIFITAGGDSNEPVELAGELSRDRGRIVDVGKCRADLPWAEYSQKELEFRFSRSYGPGRYDPIYEEQGIDYPIGYVRWTEKRNMASFLDLIAQGRLDLSPLISSVHPFDEAVAVYEDMNAGRSRGIGVLFRYPGAAPKARRLELRKASAQTGKPRLRLGVIGCGNYASSMLLPHLKGRADVELAEVVTTTPLSGANAAAKFGFASMSTDPARVFDDADIDAVMVLTPHGSHSNLVARALRAGKAVFVEKPLAITAEGLREVAQAAEESGNTRLMVGFNRRFSPLLRKMRAAFGGFDDAQFLHYRVNAGALDPASWHADRARQGGRFVGEGCHFVDTASWWFGARPVLASAVSVGADADNVAATITYDNGASAVIAYMTGGDPRYPKELIEVAGHGMTAKLDNFQTGEVWRRGKRKVFRAVAADKGQKDQMLAFVAALRDGTDMPVPFTSLVETTAVTLAVERSIALGRPFAVADILCGGRHEVS